MARVANRQRLGNWAMIHNISLFARGVGRAAESAVAFFGNALASTIRRAKFDKLTGNDKKVKLRVPL